MIRSARAIASEIAHSDAGEFLPSHCDSFRAARIHAAIRITRFLPSSTTTILVYSPFVRYRESAFFLSAPSRFAQLCRIRFRMRDPDGERKRWSEPPRSEPQFSKSQDPPKELQLKRSRLSDA